MHYRMIDTSLLLIDVLDHIIITLFDYVTDRCGTHLLFVFLCTTNRSVYMYYLYYLLRVSIQITQYRGGTRHSVSLHTNQMLHLSKCQMFNKLTIILILQIMKIKLNLLRFVLILNENLLKNAHINFYINF